MIKRTETTLDNVDPTLKPFYTENKEGTFDLNLEDPEGGKIRSQLDTATAQLTAEKGRNAKATLALAAYEAIDKSPDAIVAKLAASASGGSADPAANQKLIDAEVARQVAGVRAEHNNQREKLDATVETLTTENTGLKSSRNTATIRTQVQAEIAKIGDPQKGALEYILTSADGTFKINPETNTLEAFDKNGVKRYNRAGKEPLGVGEWLAGVIDEAPFLFKPNTGGGATGGASPANSPRGGTVDGSDPVAMGLNAEAIAKGEKTVV